MPTKKKSYSQGERLSELGVFLQSMLPHLYALFSDEDQFRGLNLIARDDGTTLAIAKSYFDDGGPSVAFGVGYGLIAALMAVDATIGAGRWKVDKFG